MCGAYLNNQLRRSRVCYSAKHPQLVSACVKDGAGGGGCPAQDDEGAEGGVGGEGGDHKEAEEEEEGGKKERRQCLPVHF